MRRRRWILLSLIVPFALLALARIVAHDQLLPFVWASSATPWIFFPAHVLLALALYWRETSASAFAGLVVACHLTWVLPTVVASDGAPPADSRPLRVADANLLYANDRPEELIEELLASDADVLILEEVSPAWLRPLTGPAITEAYPHRDLVAREDAFGIAILSRLPILHSEMLDLEGVPMIDATVALGDRTVRVFGVHTLPPVDGAYAAVWRRQLEVLHARASRVEGPLVVAGDLNATNHAAGLVRLREGGLRDAHAALGRGFATTWPNGLFSAPPLHLDHVLVSSELVTLDVREGVGAGSDHRPVIVDLALASPNSEEPHVRQATLGR